MTARLVDLLAPPWRHELDGKAYQMRPLSLATFAEMEGQGITLALLSKGDVDAWVQLYCFLAGIDYDADKLSVQGALLADPLAFTQFRETIVDAFSSDPSGKKPGSRRHSRRIDEIIKKSDSEEESESIDMGFLVLLSRSSGIPLSDLFRMTFRGVHAVQQSLEDLPPGALTMGPMMAMMGGAAGGKPGTSGRARPRPR